MSDETCDVPTSADIEAIRQRAAAIEDGNLYQSPQEVDADRRALLAVLDGERRHRADLERQIEEARELLRRVAHCYGDPAKYRKGQLTELLIDVNDFNSRQVVQEAETPGR